MNLLETIKEDDVWVLCKSVASHVATLSDQLGKIICPARFIQECCGKHPSSSPLHACNYTGKGVCSVHSRRSARISPNFHPRRHRESREWILSFEHCLFPRRNIEETERCRRTKWVLWGSMATNSEAFPNAGQLCWRSCHCVPWNASVESNFSILKWSTGEFCMALTDFSLEGFMHAKQFKLQQV